LNRPKGAGFRLFQTAVLSVAQWPDQAFRFASTRLAIRIAVETRMLKFREILKAVLAALAYVRRIT